MLKSRFLFKTFWRTWVLFVGPLIPLFWTSGDVSSGFQSQSGQPFSHFTWQWNMCNRFPEIHPWCDTCWPLGGHHGQSVSSRYLWGIGGTRNRELSCHRSQCWDQPDALPTIVCSKVDIILEEYESFLWGHWYPCFGLLVTSPLGFKARVGSLFRTSLGRGICVTGSLRYTPGVTPADLLVATMAHPSLPGTCEALVGLETGSYHAAAHSVEISQTLYQL